MPVTLESVSDLLEVASPIFPECTVTDALQAMCDADVRVLPVCSLRGQVLGLVVRDDLLRIADPDTRIGPLRRIIEPITLNTPASRVSRILKREGLRTLPVVDAEGQLLGMLDAFLLSLA